MLTRFLIPALTSAALLLAGATRALAQAPCSDCPCAAKPSDKLVQKVYSVGDLLSTMADMSRPATASAPSCCAKSADCPACSKCPQTAAPEGSKAKCCAACADGCAKCEQCQDCADCPGCPSCSKVAAQEVLMKLITNAVAPQSWNVFGGRGSIDYYPGGMALVVNQTADIQEQVAQVLAALRRLTQQAIAVDVKFLHVSEPTFTQLSRQFQLAPCCCGAPNAVTFLDDRQVKAMLETAQGERHTSCVQNPKLTVFNGQQSSFSATDKQFFVTRVQATQANGQTVYVPQNEPLETGTHLAVRPTISADRRYVRLELAVDHRSTMSAQVPLFPVTTFLTPVFEGGAVGQPIPFTQFLQQPAISKLSIQRCLVVPDGKTAVLGGWKSVYQEAKESSVPVLSDLPIVGDCFKNTEVSQETEYQLVLVTPRILVPEEEEVRQTGCLESYPDPAVAQAPAYGDAEEQEVPPPAYKEYKAAKTVAAKGGEAKLAKLLKKYDQACAEGRRSEAQKLALKALLLDPTCFQSRSSSER